MGACSAGDRGVPASYGSDGGHQGVGWKRNTGRGSPTFCGVAAVPLSPCPGPAESQSIRESCFDWPQITRTDVEIRRDPNGTLSNGHAMRRQFSRCLR